MSEKLRTPSMDDRDTPSPPRRTVEQYEADRAKGIMWNPWNAMPTGLTVPKALDAG